MGLISGAKVDAVSGEARKAKGDGRSVFVAVFKAGVLRGGSVSGELSHVGEMIAAVEAEGWRLDHFAYDGSVDKSDRVCGLFRAT